MTPLHEVIINKKTTINPIWIMRQAGRYLPEFREIRRKNPNFIELCLNQKLSSEITLLSDKNSFKYFLISSQFVESGVPKLIIRTPVFPNLIGG